MCAGDGVKYAMPHAETNMEALTVSETDANLEELQNQLKSL